ncbi:MAG: hypothetical protein WC444_05115 [Candidatus Paceibacterota bacterium]
MGYPQVSVPETSKVVSYAYSITVNGAAIGSFENFSSRSQRVVERVREILFSRGPETVELLWGGTDTSIDLRYVEMYEKSCFEAIGYPVYALEDMNFPVTIIEVMKLPDSIGGIRQIEYIDAVCESWGKELEAGAPKVVSSMTFQIRKVKGTRLS